MEKLKAKLKALFKTLEAKHEELNTALVEDDVDQEAVKALEAKVDSITKQANMLKAQIERMEANKATSAYAKSLTDDDDDAATKVTGRAGGAPPAEPIDHAAKEVHQLKAFGKWCSGARVSDNEFDNLLNPQNSSKTKYCGNPEEYAAVPDVVKTILLGKKVGHAMGFMPKADFMGTGGSSTGGLNALVDPDYLAEMQKEAYPEALMIDLVRVIGTDSGVLNMPVFTQADGQQKFGFIPSWIEEGDQKPTKVVATTNEQIVTHELAASFFVTERALSRSAIAFEPFLAELATGALRYEISRTLVSGNGSTQPLGLVNHTGIREVKRQLAAAVLYTDLTGVQYKVPREDRRGGSYIIEDSVEKYLLETTDSDGRTLFSASMSDGIKDRLVGRQYATATETPTIGNDGDVIFGNMKNYIMLLEEDIIFGKSPHERYTKNQVAFKVFAVVGGKSPVPRTFAKLGSDESS